MGFSLFALLFFSLSSLLSSQFIMASTRTQQALAKLADLTPRQIAAELDRYIVGQADAKKAVAIALRNRWRRQRAPGIDSRRDLAEQHHPDRADGRRQDGKSPAASPKLAGALLHQGRSVEVHRGRLPRRPRRRVRWCAISSRVPSTWCAASASRKSRSSRTTASTSACSIFCFHPRRPRRPGNRRSRVHAQRPTPIAHRSR